MNINLNGSGNITINGQTFTGHNVVIKNNEVFVDNVKTDITDEQIVNIEIHGDVLSVSNVSGDVETTGDINKCTNINGNIYCKEFNEANNVNGDIIKK